jgi:pre-mRNA-splicing factor CWC22
MYTNSISWNCLKCIKLTEEDTTASSRIFVKILFQEIASNLGLQNLVARLNDKAAEESGLKPYIEGIFPRDSIQNARFSVNYFTSIGLGALTEDLREFLQNAPKLLLLEKKYQEMVALANQISSSDDSDSDSESDSSGSSSSSLSRRSR